MTPRALGVVVRTSLAAEGLTAAALLAVPDVVALLLFGSGLDGGGPAMARMLGVALIALVVACWPGAGVTAGTRAAFRGLLAYNLLATAYLLLLALSGPRGILLWPAVAAHGAVSVLLLAGGREFEGGAAVRS